MMDQERLNEQLSHLKNEYISIDVSGDSCLYGVDDAYVVFSEYENAYVILTDTDVDGYMPHDILDCGHGYNYGFTLYIEEEGDGQWDIDSFSIKKPKPKQEVW